MTRFAALLAPVLAGCVALAGGAREESEARAPVVLPPPPGPVEEPPPVSATTSTTLGQGATAVGTSWSGQYACLGDPVALTVRVEGAHGATVQVVVELPSGRYEASGELDPDSGALELTPTRWLEPAQPPVGTSMLGLFGTLSPGGDVYEGRVTNPGCRWFSLHR